MLPSTTILTFWLIFFFNNLNNIRLHLIIRACLKKLVAMYKCRIKGTKFEVIVENDEQVELSFTRTWDPSQEGKLVPLNIDKRSSLLINVLKYN